MNNQFIQRTEIDWDGIGRDSYLWEIEVLKRLEGLELLQPITLFVGESGDGGSTLLEAIAVAYGFSPEGGTKNCSFSIYGSHSRLREALKVPRGYRKANWRYSLRAESFYNVTTKELEYSDSERPLKKYHEKSHGESFLALTQSQLRASRVYLFGEPEAALSPQRQLTLFIEVYRCTRRGAQFIIIAHSSILLGMLEAEIMTLDDGVIHNYEYRDTDSYQVTEMSINDREQVLDRLLNNG